MQMQDVGKESQLTLTVNIFYGENCQQASFMGFNVFVLAVLNYCPKAYLCAKLL